MKSTDTLKELRDMKEVDLREKYEELSRELFNLRFQGATTQLSSPARFTQVRRQLARLKTIAREKNYEL